MSKISQSLTFLSIYGQNSKIAKCLFIDDDQPIIMTSKKITNRTPIEYEKQTILSFMVNIPRLRNVYLYMMSCNINDHAKR